MDLSRFDLRHQVDAHPWQLIGTAALLGAWLGFESPRTKRDDPAKMRRWLADVLLSAVGALALRAVREIALRQFAVVAKRWWDEGRQPLEGDVPDAPYGRRRPTI